MRELSFISLKKISGAKITFVETLVREVCMVQPEGLKTSRTASLESMLGVRDVFEKAIELSLLFEPLPVFLNASSSVNHLFFARIERMAIGADFNLQFLFGRSSFNNVAAGTGNLGFGEVCRVDILFHSERIIAGFWSIVNPAPLWPKSKWCWVKSELLPLGRVSTTIGRYD